MSFTIERPDVVVLDAEQRSALATVRSLGARGLRVCCASVSSNALASVSKYCSSHLKYPDPAESTAAFESWLKSLSAAWKDVVVLPLTDTSVPLVLKAIESGVRLRSPLPDSDVYDLVVDKLSIGELAKDFGLQVPLTTRITRLTLPIVDSSNYIYPVVIKPQRSARIDGSKVLRRSVSYANSKIELVERLNHFLVDDADEVLLQQFVSGTGMGIFALYDRGVPKVFFSHLRIREKPPSGGVSVLSVSQALPSNTTAAVHRLLSHLHWHGPAMVEFKLDAKGEAWFMEINARLWGSVQLAVDAGVDFPAFVYELAQGKDLCVAQEFFVGQRLRWLLGDLDSLYLTIKNREISWRDKMSSLSKFLIPWQRNLRYEVFRFNDPKPGVRELADYLYCLIRRRG